MVEASPFYRCGRAVAEDGGQAAMVSFKRINAIDGREGLRRDFKRGIKVGSKGVEAASRGSELGGTGRPEAAVGRLARVVRGGRGWA
jgi:hypothetical protein